MKKGVAAAFKYRGANYRNFLMSLRTKVAYRRDLEILVTHMTNERKNNVNQ